MGVNNVGSGAVRLPNDSSSSIDSSKSLSVQSISTSETDGSTSLIILDDVVISVDSSPLPTAGISLFGVDVSSALVIAIESIAGLCGSSTSAAIVSTSDLDVRLDGLSANTVLSEVEATATEVYA